MIDVLSPDVNLALKLEFRSVAICFDYVLEPDKILIKMRQTVSLP